MAIQFWQIDGLQAFYDTGLNGVSTMGPTGASWQALDALYVSPDPGATHTADFAEHGCIWMELTEACTITVAGVGSCNFSPMSVRTVRLFINTQTYAVTWAAGITWIGGAPTLANDTTSILEFFSPDNGTTVYGRAIADGLTEITAPLRDSRMAYAFGGKADYKYRTVTLMDMVNEALLQHATGMQVGSNSSLGGVSDLISTGWINTGTMKERGLEKIKLPTGTILQVYSTLQNYGDYDGSSNAMYGENGGANSVVYFAPGTTATTGAYNSACTFNMSTEATGQKYVTFYFHNTTTLSDDTKGWFIGTDQSGQGNYRVEINMSTTAATTNTSFPASWAPWAVGNDQSTNGYIMGGRTTTELFGHDDIRRFVFSTAVIGTTLTAALPANGDLAMPYGNTLTHNYCYGVVGWGWKFDWSTETRSAWVPSGRLLDNNPTYPGAVLNEYTRN